MAVGNAATRKMITPLSIYIMSELSEKEKINTAVSKFSDLIIELIKRIMLPVIGILLQVVQLLYAFNSMLYNFSEIIHFRIHSCNKVLKTHQQEVQCTAEKRLFRSHWNIF